MEHHGIVGGRGHARHARQTSKQRHQNNKKQIDMSRASQVIAEYRGTEGMTRREGA